MSDPSSSDLRLSDDRWSERLTRSQKHIALIRYLTDFYVQKPFAFLKPLSLRGFSSLK
jgi:hypothetical protein